MKNKYQIILKSLIVLVLSFSVSGCGEEFLTQYPQDKLTAGTFYKSDADFIAAANGVYDAMVKRNEAEFIAMLDMATPFADCAGGRLNVYQMRRTNGVIDINDGYWGSSTFWPIFWNIISRANNVLANIDIEGSEVTDAIRNRTEGELLFLRAYAYFNLVQLFGDVPLITEPMAFEELAVARSPKAQVMDQMIADLTRAQEILPSVKTYRGTGNIGRVSKGAAQALLGKTYLYREDWSNAEIWLDKVIASGDYQLEPYYVDMFWPSGENGIESIFEVQYKSLDPDGGGDRNRWPQYAGFHNNSQAYWAGGWNYVHPTEYYCDQFETVNGYKVQSEFVSKESSTLMSGGFNFNYNFLSDDPAYDPANPYALRDPRLKWTAWHENTPYIDEDYTQRSLCDGVNWINDYSKATNHASVKYLTGKVSPKDDSDMNMIVIRYADVLLMAAEAKIEQNKLAPAIERINQVRQRPSTNMPTVQQVEAIQGIDISGNQDNLRKYMRVERYRELAFEWGHMYYDQIRWKIFDDEMEKFWVTGRDGFTDFPSFQWDESWWLWPIPARDMNKNDNLTQNPGY